MHGRPTNTLTPSLVVSMPTRQKLMKVHKGDPRSVAQDVSKVVCESVKYMLGQLGEVDETTVA